MFVLCDVMTGYILRFIVYTGASTTMTMMKELGFSGSVVLELLNHYLGKGHSLFVDNWYTSPALFQYLQGKQTNACGTVRQNRKGLPKFKKKMRRGEVESFHTDTLLALKWFDKREVHLLTSMHEAHLEDTGKVDRRTGTPQKKPACVLEYNQKMGLVDKVDMQLSFTESIRKTLKWYKKFFFHLLDMSLLNAFLLHRERSASKITFAEFRRRVVYQLVEEHHTERRKGGRPSGDNPTRLTARHFLERVPQTSAKGSRTQRRCHVCANTALRPKQRKDTRFMCAACDKGLCVEPCFKDYHTLKKY
ncbi:piggyBac transposable element-derived protein 4-like [Ixodes scapularis]|uniref:piggyBac transposable element-derived protein 4-like n=1 Tax=Ixodes scapularis TaxID=6945 RepID=UPI001A9E1D3C|nr:piggyBac transposable element-derived protein 4-like [Ixodes scapularis]